jgi:hypothetical protein
MPSRSDVRSGYCLPAGQEGFGMKRRTRRLLLVVLGPMIGLAIAGPAAASAAPGSSRPARSAPHAQSAIVPAAASARAGFVHWDGGTDQTTTYNSTGGAVNFIRFAAGSYVVSFAGFGSAGADAQVSTPVTNATCSVAFVTLGIVSSRVEKSRAASEGDSSAASGAALSAASEGASRAASGAASPAASDQDFGVQCYDATGTQVDEPFDLLVTRPPRKPSGVLDFDWVYKGALGSLNANPKARPFQYNSSGKVNSVSHPGTGKYVVTMPGSSGAGNNHGTVKVSPYGPGGGSCQVGNWTATRTAQKITVLCFDHSGIPQDRQFTVSYARGNNLMGRNGLTDANASVRSGGANPVSQPAIQFDSRPNAKVTVVHTDHGQYVVLFAGSIPTGQPNGGNGHIQITPVGTSYHRCGYSIIPSHTPELDVSCTGPTGPLADSAFTVQWVVS